jgi:hypothetical protein
MGVAAGLAIIIGSALFTNRDRLFQGLPLSNNETILASNPSTNESVPKILNVSVNPVWWAQELGSESSDGWTLLWDRAAGASRILGYSDNGFMYLNVAEQASQLSVTGEWGEYSTAANTGFKPGEVIGAVVLHGQDSGFTLTLSFLSFQDRSRREVTYYVSSHPEIDSQANFVKTIEANPWLPNLLSNEIQPRDLDLGNYLDALMPSSDEQRLNVPWISSDMAPEYDGVLEEEIWQNPFFGKSGREGELLLVENNSPKPLLVRHDETTLYLGLSVPHVEADEWGVEIGIRQTIQKPLINSPKCILKIDSSEKYDLRGYENDREVAFPQKWSILSAIDNDFLSAEIGIPFDEGFNIGEETRVRLVCTVWHINTDGERETTIYWGAKTPDDIAHGALLCLVGK